MPQVKHILLHALLHALFSVFLVLIMARKSSVGFEPIRSNAAQPGFHLHVLSCILLGVHNLTLNPDWFL